MLKIIQAPNALLNQVAEPVESFDDELSQKVSDMIETLLGTPVAGGGRAIGLAGPQVGYMRRVLVVCLPYDTPREVINPVVVSTSGDKVRNTEGCLSIGGGALKRAVERPRKVVIEYQTKTGARCRTKAAGLLATVLQHEIDHLDGKLIA